MFDLISLRSRMPVWCILFRVWILSMTLLMTSCIDTREEYWIEANGSGHAEIIYQVPEAVAQVYGGAQGIRELLEKVLNSTPEIESSECKVTTESERLRVEVRAKFSSALNLRKITTSGSLEQLPSAASGLVGDITANLHGRTLDFSRTVAMNKAIPGAAFLPTSQLEGHRATYIIHLPAVAESSNATRTEDAGRTLVWDIPLAHALREPFTTRFQVDIPIPWKLIITAGLALISTIGLSFVLWRKFRK